MSFQTERSLSFRAEREILYRSYTGFLLTPFVEMTVLEKLPDPLNNYDMPPLQGLVARVLIATNISPLRGLCEDFKQLNLFVKNFLTFLCGLCVFARNICVFILFPRSAWEYRSDAPLATFWDGNELKTRSTTQSVGTRIHSLLSTFRKK